MTPQREVVLDGDLSLDIQMDGDMSLNIPADGESGTVIKVTEYDLPVYSGQTEITPSEDAQTLQTADKTVLQNIIVNPIPENYGRLLWTGNTLTVY